MGRFIAVDTNWGYIVAEQNEEAGSYQQFAESSTMSGAQRLRDALNAQDGAGQPRGEQ